MRLRNPSRNREPQSRTAAVGTKEALEDSLAHFRCNPASAVMNFDAQLAVRGEAPHEYASAGRHMLDRVLDQISDQPLHQILIAAHHQIGLMLLGDRYSALGRQRPEGVYRLRDHLIEIKAFIAHRILSGIAAREQEKIADDARQPLHRLAHDLEAVTV